MARDDDKESFLFNFKSFVTSEDEATKYLEASRTRASRRSPRALTLRKISTSGSTVIPQSGQIQDLIAQILKENNVTDIFNVNLAYISSSANTRWHWYLYCPLMRERNSSRTIKTQWYEKWELIYFPSLNLLLRLMTQVLGNLSFDPLIF